MTEETNIAPVGSAGAVSFLADAATIRHRLRRRMLWMGLIVALFGLVLMPLAVISPPWLRLELVVIWGALVCEIVVLWFFVRRQAFRIAAGTLTLRLKSGKCAKPWIGTEETIKMDGYEVKLYYSPEDGYYVAEIAELVGCAADGSTAEEALANLREVKAVWIHGKQQMNHPIPPPRHPAASGRAHVGSMPLAV